MKYSVSQFAVRNSDAESINSGNASTSLSWTPMPKNPRRIAANDAPGKLLMNASTPCMKSRLSYSSAAVASDGAPSSNSNVPRRLSTRSGVEIDRSVSAETVKGSLLVGGDGAKPERDPALHAARTRNARSRASLSNARARPSSSRWDEIEPPLRPPCDCGPTPAKASVRPRLSSAGDESQVLTRSDTSGSRWRREETSAVGNAARCQVPPAEPPPLAELAGLPVNRCWSLPGDRHQRGCTSKWSCRS